MCLFACSIFYSMKSYIYQRNSEWFKQQRLIINANANPEFTINNKILASACFEINTGYLELSERQSWIWEELADVKKYKNYTEGKNGLDLTHVFQTH